MTFATESRGIKTKTGHEFVGVRVASHGQLGAEREDLPRHSLLVGVDVRDPPAVR
eukprot:COSAG04_NODE_270_length_18507_cov_125.250380_3_plen_55_part_00